MDRRNFLKLVGCAILAPTVTLVRERPKIVPLQETLNKLVRFKMNECQAMLRKQMMESFYYVHSSPICEIGLRYGNYVYIRYINPRNFWKVKTPPNNKIS